MLDRFNATIHEIYSAAADPSRWAIALAAVERLTGSEGAVVHIVPKRQGGELVTLLGESAQGYFLAEHVEEWTRDYAAICPRLAAATRWPNTPFYVDYMLMDEREMDLNPVYNWYGSYGLRYFIGSRLCHDDDVEIVWSLQRRRDQGHVQQPDIDIFELMKPHLARSLDLARQLGTLSQFERFSSDVFYALPQPLFALREDGQLLFANDAGAELIRNSDGISVGVGRLQLASSSEQATLDSLVTAAAGAATAARTGWTRISRPSGKTPYAVLVAPLRTDNDAFADGTVKVLVVVHDSAARRTIEPETLCAIYSLTEAEARLASAIAAGHSLESASALLHVQIATGRSHLKSIFAKMGVHRQQDLVGLLASLSMVKF